jgi:hypothetical protein
MLAKAKPKSKPIAKTISKKAAKPVRKAAPKVPKAPALTCGVCGYRVIIDRACGCVEEHVLLCCGQPMIPA